jgi:hypothetical protein
MVLLILLMMPVHLIDLQFTLNIGVAIVVLIATLNVRIVSLPLLLSDINLMSLSLNVTSTLVVF